VLFCRISQRQDRSHQMRYRRICVLSFWVQKVQRLRSRDCYYYYRVLRAICCQPVDGSLICFM